MRQLTGAYVEERDLLAFRHLRPNVTSQSDRVAGVQSGLRVSRQKGRGVDFAEVRLYQAGDDIRTIDWRVTARKNKPHTKVFREERERPTLILCDQSQALFFGSQVRLKSVAAAEITARLAWLTIADNDRVGGLVLGNEAFAAHKPRRSLKSTARFLHDVATYNRQLVRGATAEPRILAEALLALRRLAHTGYRIILVSDFSHHYDLWHEAIQALARRNHVTVVEVYDPLEARLPEAQTVSVTNGASRLRLNTGERRLREHYERQFASRQARLTETCAHESIRYYRQATADVIQQVVAN